MEIMVLDVKRLRRKFLKIQALLWASVYSSGDPVYQASSASCQLDDLMSSLGLEPYSEAEQKEAYNREYL